MKKPRGAAFLKGHDPRRNLDGAPKGPRQLDSICKYLNEFLVLTPKEVYAEYLKLAAQDRDDMSLKKYIALKWVYECNLSKKDAFNKTQALIERVEGKPRQPIQIGTEEDMDESITVKIVRPK